jgi:Rrf2 family protein
MSYRLLPTRAVAVIDGLVVLAKEGPGAVMSLAAISERLGLPPRYLEAVAQSLVKDGVLTGVRGPSGGYRLGRPANKTRVAHVLSTVLGKLDDVGGPTSATYTPSGAAETILARFEAAAYEGVTGVTLADMID